MADESFDPQAFVDGTIAAPSPPPEQESAQTISGGNVTDEQGNILPPEQQGIPQQKSVPSGNVFNPSRTTYYYPASREETAAAGLSYRMEGGTQGSGQFSDLYLPDHTYQQYDAGTSPFVAVAMKGAPLGQEFPMAMGSDGKIRLAKVVDTGGGLVDGQVDVASGNPQDAKTGGDAGTSVFNPHAFARGLVLTPDLYAKLYAEAPPVEPETPEPAQPQEREGGGGFQFQPTPLPQLTLPQGLVSQMPVAPPTQLPQGIPTPNVAPIVPVGTGREFVGAPAFAGGINLPPGQPQPGELPEPPGQGTLGPVGRLMALPPLISQEQGQTIAAQALQSLNQFYPPAQRSMEYLESQYPDVTQALQQVVGDQISGLSSPASLAMVPAMAVPGAAEAYAMYQLTQTPRAIAGLHQTIKQYGLRSPEAMRAIGNEGTRLATAVVAPLASRAFHGGAPPGEGAPTGAGGVPPEPPGGAVGGAGVPTGVPMVKTNPVRGSGKFRRTYRIDKELGDRLEQIGASRETGRLVANQHLQKMLKGLNDQQVENIGKYLVSKRLHALNPGHMQVLNPLEEAQLLQDPKFRNALDYYINNIKPEIEGYRLRAGLSPKAAMSKGPEFMSLIPKEPPQGGALSQFRRKPKQTTSFAKAAHGYAPSYETDIHKVLDKSYEEAMRSAYNREFIGDATAKGVADNPTVQAQLHSANPQLEDESSGPVLEALKMAQQKTTGLALTANSAELANHMRRQFNILAGKPAANASILSRIIEPLIPYIGPKGGAFRRAVMDDMSTPENQAILRDIFDAGGGSTRGFGEHYRSSGVVGKYTGVKWLQDKAHNLLFKVPEGRGISGWDLRMRVQLEKIRRAEEGNVDPQRIREFANQIGQYGSQNDWLISAAKAINPYAGTTLPMRWTELKQAVGISGLESPTVKGRLMNNAETLLRGTGGTLLGLSAASYMLSGKWPWQNAPGHEFDLDTGQKYADGTPIYLKMRVIAPELSRPLNTTGIPEALRERGEKDPQYGAAVERELFNQGLEVLVGSPLAQTAWTGATGTAPYFVRDERTGQNKLMPTVKVAPGESRVGKQAISAVSQLNPALHRLATATGLVPTPASQEQLPLALRLLQGTGLFGPSMYSGPTYHPQARPRHGQAAAPPGAGRARPGTGGHRRRR